MRERLLPATQKAGRLTLRVLAMTCVPLLSSCGPRTEVIAIGCSAPLTGDQAKIGIDMLNGVILAVEQANARGDTLPGMKLLLVPLDDQHSPSQAVNVAKKFVVDANLVGVLGHLNSSCTKPASAVYHEAGLVQITPASTNPEISKQGFNTFFRVSPTDDVQGPQGANYAFKTLGLKSVFIIDDKTTYGKGIADEFEKQVHLLGVNLLGHEGITAGDKDFTALLTKIKALDPDLIYHGGYYPEMALLVKQGRDLGVRARLMGGDGVADSLLVKLATPAAAEGVLATMVGADMKKVPTAQTFVKAYETRFGELGLYSAYGYDAANILIEAIRRAGKKDRAAVLEEVRKTRNFPGVTGTVNFDARGDSTNKSIGIFEVRDGRFEYIGPAD